MKLNPNERKRSVAVLNRELRSIQTTKHGFLDLETYNEIEIDNDVFSYLDSKAYAVGWLDHNNNYRSFFGEDCLIRFLTELSKEEGEIVIGIHNAAYDVPYLIRALALNNLSTKSGEFTFTSEQFIISSNIKWPKLKVRFGCTWFGDKTMSLRNGGKVIGKTQKKSLGDIEKFNLDNNLTFLVGDNDGFKRKEFNMLEEKEYLRNDVLIIPEIVEVIKERKLELLKLARSLRKEAVSEAQEKLNNNKMTQSPIKSNAGASKDCFAMTLGEDFQERYRPQVDPGFYRSMVKGYVAGFTSGTNDKYKVDDERIKVFDINSMYPSIMIHGVPHGHPILGKPRKGSKDIHGVEVKGTFCEWKDEGAFFDNKFFGKNFDFGKKSKEDEDMRVTFTILKETYDLADVMCCHDLEIIRDGHQPLCTKLADYIANVYERRQKIKASLKDLKRGSSEGVAANNEQECLKICLNSLYGKLAENHHPTKLEISSKDPYLREVDNDPEYPCILSGSYVTAKARLMLMKAVMAEVEEGNEFLYCDTDSLFIIDKTGKRAIEIDEYKLGAWKDEGTYNRFRYGGKHKKYVLYHTDKKNKDGSRYIKMALSGIACKQIIEQHGPYEDIDKIFDPSISITFIKCKTADKEVDPRFGISCLMKTNYETYKHFEKVGRKKISRHDYKCEAPYTELVKGDA